MSSGVFDSKGRIRLAIHGALFGLVAYALAAQLPPFSVLFLGVFALLQITFWHAGRRGMLLYYLSFVFFALGIGEIALWQRPEKVTIAEGTATTDLFIPDGELGYAIRPGERRLRSAKRRREDGTTVFDVGYNIDAHGFRVTPGPVRKPPVLFFGDSYTFGEGVDDADTLPAQFSKLADREALNLGVPGYGPHQFLRMLETGRMEKAGIGDRPALVVYTLLPTHIDRAAGRARWDRHGPLYEFSPTALRLRGKFTNTLTRAMLKSNIYQTVQSRLQDSSKEEKKARRRTLAILERARDLLEDRYEAALLVVLWDVSREEPSPGRAADRSEWLAHHLSQSGFQILRASRLDPIPKGDGYYIAGDGHPNAAAYGVVASALANYCGAKRCNAIAQRVAR